MMSEEEWNNNFSHEIYSSSPDEHANFMAQLLGNSSLPSDQCWPLQESAKNHLTSIYSSGSSSGEYNHFFSQGSSASGFNNAYQVLEAENNAKSMHYYCCDIETQSPEFNMMETAGDDFLLINQDLCYDSNMESNEMNHADDHHITNGHHEIRLHIRATHDQMLIPVNNENNDQSQSSGGGKVSNPSLDIYMKRLRDPIDNDPKDKRPLQRKNQKVASSSDGHEEDDKKIINTTFKRQNTMISCSSADEDDDDSIAPSRCSSKRGGAIPNLNEKTRTSRGSATDPPSLYARKRRERINERLKILQNLVPNGTKVDISTMLEEAVQYVKFLQLQIKLLSSDDLWMYSPIAYNGMDIGLDLKIATANNAKS